MDQIKGLSATRVAGEGLEVVLLGYYFSNWWLFFGRFFLNFAFMLRFIKAIRFVEIWLIDLL